jgi:hypothetical protein
MSPMENLKQLQEKLNSITKTLGNHDVRDLVLYPIKNKQLIVIGEIKLQSDEHWTAMSWDLNGKWNGKEEHTSFNLKID